jgi:hypothetical protein
VERGKQGGRKEKDEKESRTSTLGGEKENKHSDWVHTCRPSGTYSK